MAQKFRKRQVLWLVIRHPKLALKILKIQWDAVAPLFLSGTKENRRLVRIVFKTMGCHLSSLQDGYTDYPPEHFLQAKRALSWSQKNGFRSFLKHAGRFATWILIYLGVWLLAPVFIVMTARLFGLLTIGWTEVMAVLSTWLLIFGPLFLHAMSNRTQSTYNAVYLSLLMISALLLVAFYISNAFPPAILHLSPVSYRFLLTLSVALAGTIVVSHIIFRVTSKRALRPILLGLGPALTQASLFKLVKLTCEADSSTWADASFRANALHQLDLVAYHFQIYLPACFSSGTRGQRKQFKQRATEISKNF